MLGDERCRLTLAAVGILCFLTLAVSIMRLHRLSELPPGLHHDEGTHGVNALQVMRGEHAAFFPENNGREGMIVYAIALATSFLGRTALAVRLPTALVSAGTVFVLFWPGLDALWAGRGKRPAHPLAGSPNRRSRRWFAGSIPRTDSYWAHRAQRQPPPFLSLPVLGSALVGVAAAPKASLLTWHIKWTSVLWTKRAGCQAQNLVADRVGRRVYRASIIHLHNSPVHALFVSLFRLEFSVSQEQNW